MISYSARLHASAPTLPSRSCSWTPSMWSSFIMRHSMQVLAFVVDCFGVTDEQSSRAPRMPVY